MQMKVSEMRGHSDDVDTQPEKANLRQATVSSDNVTAAHDRCFSAHKNAGRISLAWGPGGMRIEMFLLHRLKTSGTGRG